MFVDFDNAHIVMEIGFVGMCDKSKYAIVGQGHNNRVNVLWKGHTVHIWKHFLIVLEGFIKAVVLEFWDRKDFGVVHLVIVLVLGVKDSV